MGTFCAVNDTTLMSLIQGAHKRIVYIAPGVHESVAESLARRFGEVNDIDITIILDSDEDVCRIGYGDLKGLQRLNDLAKENGLGIRSQPGLRLGILLADEKMMVWSPTPRSIEAPPDSMDTQSCSAQYIATNGLLLGTNPGNQVADAIAVDGINSGQRSAEIGKDDLTSAQVQETVNALEKNPPIPVDLARITRVYTTKLQFVEFTVKGAKISHSQLKVPNLLLNADAKSELRDLIESRLHAFADLRDKEIRVPAFIDGEPAYDESRKRKEDSMSESSLLRLRNDIEKRFIYNITGYGRLIEKDRKAQFEKQVKAFKIQLLEYSKGIRQLLDKQAKQILDEAVGLIMARMSHAEEAGTMGEMEIRKELQNGLERAKSELPSVSLIFKDVTYEQTQSAEFRNRVCEALPASVVKRLGSWDEHFKAAVAKQTSPSS